jgi:hypothetical protein
MSICQTGNLGQHRWEYAHTRDGGDVYICLNASCGETLIEHLDCFGG